MSFKKILAFIFLILTVILITFGIFFFLNKEDAEKPNQEGFIFPLGTDNGSGLRRGDTPSGPDTNIPLTNTGSGPSAQTIKGKQELRLRKLYDEPISGGSVSIKKIFVDREIEVVAEDIPNGIEREVEIITEEKDSYEILFVDRKNGHIIQDLEHEANQKTLTNTTILQVYESLLSKNHVIMRYLDSFQENIQTFVGSFRNKEDNLVTKREEGEEVQEDDLSEVFQEKPLNGILLPENIDVIVLGPKKDEFLYTIRNNNQTEVRRTSFTSPSNYQIVHTSPFRDITISWVEDSYFLLASKPDSRTTGFVERISLENNTVTTIRSGNLGLSISRDPSGEYTILKETTRATLALQSSEFGTRQTDIYGLPEKCIWANTLPGIAYCAGQSFNPQLPVPEAWYQGNFSYQDSLYKVDVLTGSTSVVLNPSNEGVESMDIIPLSLSEDDRRILFMDKNTLEPWVLKLE